jgi:hypothetical protein
VIKLRRMRNAYKILVGKPNGGDHSEDLGVDWSIILEWMLGKYGGKLRTAFVWFRVGTSDGLL